MRTWTLVFPSALLLGCMGARSELSEPGPGTRPAGSLAEPQPASAPTAAGARMAKAQPAASARTPGAMQAASASPSSSSTAQPPAPSAAPSAKTGAARMRETVPARAAQGLSLLGVFWNGSAWQVDRIDDASGASMIVGTFGDLRYWSDVSLQSPDGARVFSMGNDANEANKLYVLEIADGSSHSLALEWQYELAGMLADGRLIAVNGAVSLEALDPQTGQETQNLGVFGDLATAFWSWLAVDAARQRVYGLGTAKGDVRQMNLYAFDVASGTTRSLPVAVQSWAFGGVRSDGSLLAMSWTGKREVAAAIDPETGAVRELGQVGDLHLQTWDGRPVYAVENDSLYAVGFDAQDTRFLYRFDLASGTSSQVPVGADYILVKR